MKRIDNLVPILTAVFSPIAFAAAATVDLRIMETTDIHMHIANYDYYRDSASDSVGLSKVATLISQARSEVSNSVLVDNGDLLQGNPLGDYVAKGRVLRIGETHPAFKAMNLMDYDVGNVGNHEFNYGLDFLANSLAGANFPYVSANVYVDDGDNNPDNDQPYFQPYIIKPTDVTDSLGQKHQINIGYIGFTPPQIMNWDKDKLTHRVIAKDIVSSAEKYVPVMKSEGADLIIAIPHSGLYANPRIQKEEHAVYHLAKVKDIDAILFGHSHQVFPGGTLFNDMPGVDNENGTVFDVPAVMPGFWGSHLGIIDLTLEQKNNRWSVINSLSEVRAISKREGREVVPLVAADETINDAIKQDHEGTLAYMRQKVGITTAPIYSYFSQIQDDPSVQVVNNAQIWYVENIVRGTEYDGLPILSAAAPFKAGGRGGADYYTDVPQGDIALKNVSDLYIYPNDLKVVKLTGAQVIEWLERSAGQFNQIDPTRSDIVQPLVNESFPSYNFDVIDGIEYAIDVTQPNRYAADGTLENPNAHRILDVKFNNKRINKKQEFLIVTNNYRSGGGGKFPNLDGSTTIIDAPDKNRDVIANYLLSQAEINPEADGNWSFANWGKAQVSIRTSPKARDFAGDNLSFEGIEEDGFALFQFK